MAPAVNNLESYQNVFGGMVSARLRKETEIPAVRLEARDVVRPVEATLSQTSLP